MAGKSKYSDEDKARVNLSLQVHDGQVKPTARDTGIPISTVRLWKQQWERDGVPQSVEMALTEAKDDFVENASRVRDKALERLGQVIETSDKPRDLATVVGILDDKIARARGLPTSRTENVSIGIQGSPEQVQALFTQWAQNTITAGVERHADIESSAWEEQPEGDSPAEILD